MKSVLQKMGLKEGERIESGLVSRSIGKAQKNVENHNFDIRKNLVEYDQVRSEQRRIIYTLRQRVLDGEDMKANVMQMVDRRLQDAVSRFIPKGSDADMAGLGDWFKSRFGVDAKLEGLQGQEPEAVVDALVEQAEKAYLDRERVVGLSEARGAVAALARRYMPEHGELVKNFAEFSKQVKDRTGVTVPESLVRLPQAEMVDGVTELVASDKREEVGKRGAAAMRSLERFVLLNKIDEKWKDMLYNMDQLRDIVGMRSFAQQDPKLEFKRDATELFGSMMEAIDEDVTTLVFRMSEVPEDEARLAKRWQAAEYRKDEVGQFAMAGGENGNGSGNGNGEGGEDEKPVPVRVEKKPGRNELCWCSSGKKYKKCHWPN
jgi:preprotein translocase subunit SecA